MKKTISPLLVFFCIAAMAQQPISDHYKIYDTHKKQLCTLDEVVAGMNDADVLFFGEEHSDSAGHYLEAALFTAMHQAYGTDIAISLEMFETDCQLVVDEYLAGLISEERFIKEGRAWSNYKDYRPAVEYAKANGIPVIAADPPRRYVNMVSRKGMKSLDSLSRAAKKYLPPLPYDTLSGRYYEKFREFMGGGSPGTNNPRIYYSQSLWDAGMAHSIYRYQKKHKGKKILHFVGRFHSDEKLGTAAQLQNRNARLRIRNISCFSDASFSNPDWEKFAALGDYIILTDPGLKKTF